MSESKKLDRRTHLLGGVAAAVAIAGFAAPAMAQANGEEIVVTAERRTQNLSDVPIAATVLNATMLAERGVRNVVDLQNVAPSLVINVYNRSTYINLRGIGLAVSAPNVVQGVPFYMNGAYIAYESTIRGSFYDLGSVEVLRGPQGTLTGLNSTGGAVYMRSPAPRLGVYSAYMDTTLSGYDGVRAVAAANLPIGDKVAVRIAAMKDEQDSFTENLGPGSQVGNLDNYSLRADVVMEPTDRLSVNVRGEYYRSDTNYNAVKRRDDANPNPFQVAEDAASRSVIDNWRGDLEINLQATDALKLRYQAARGVANQFDLGDRNRAVGGASNNLSLTRIDPASWTHEVDLISTGESRLQWMLGGFYMEQTQPTFLFRYANPSLPIPSTTDVLTALIDIDNTSKAAFGQANYKFTDQWELTLGARYSEDEQLFTRKGGAPGFSATDLKRDETTGKVALNYKPNDNNMVYASVSRGYKPGGVNLVLAQGVFEPETDIVSELGWKTSLMDKRLKVNADVFNSEYKNAQFAALVGGLPATSNAPSVHSYGAELEAFGNFDDLGFNLGVAYLNAEFDQATSLVDPATGLASAVPSGRRMTFSPEWTLNAGAQYDIHIGDRILTPRVQYSFVDDQFATPFPNGTTLVTHNSLVPSHGVWDARLTLRASNVFTTELFVSNLTDETYIASQLQNASSQVGGYIYGAPRVFGLRIKYSFGE